MISDAQARLLSVLDENRGETVLAWREAGRFLFQITRLEHGDGATLDHHGRTGGVERLIDVDPLAPALLPLASARVSTVVAVATRGLAEMTDRDVETQRVGVCWFVRPRTLAVQEVAITDLGRIELGRWRQLAARRGPPAPPPLLAADARALELARDAIAAGYRLVPFTAASRDQARRLGRGPWASRGWSSPSARSLVPSSAALVELDPGAADLPPLAATA